MIIPPLWGSAEHLLLHAAEVPGDHYGHYWIGSLTQLVEAQLIEPVTYGPYRGDVSRPFGYLINLTFAGWMAVDMIADHTKRAVG
jgi:hypothetical protein